MCVSKLTHTKEPERTTLLINFYCIDMTSGRPFYFLYLVIQVCVRACTICRHVCVCARARTGECVCECTCMVGVGGESITFVVILCI